MTPPVVSSPRPRISNDGNVVVDAPHPSPFLGPFWRWVSRDPRRLRVLFNTAGLGDRRARKAMAVAWLRARLAVLATLD